MPARPRGRRRRGEDRTPCFAGVVGAIHGLYGMQPIIVRYQHKPLLGRDEIGTAGADTPLCLAHRPAFPAYASPCPPSISRGDQPAGAEGEPAVLGIDKKPTRKVAQTRPGAVLDRISPLKRPGLAAIFAMI